MLSVLLSSAVDDRLPIGGGSNGIHPDQVVVAAFAVVAVWYVGRSLIAIKDDSGAASIANGLCLALSPLFWFIAVTHIGDFLEWSTETLGNMAFVILTLAGGSYLLRAALRERAERRRELHPRGNRQDARERKQRQEERERETDAARDLDSLCIELEDVRSKIDAERALFPEADARARARTELEAAKAELDRMRAEQPKGPSGQPLGT